MSRRIGIASLIWGFSILLSRVIGLVREAVIGRVLGGGSAADVYWTAFVVPDFLNYLLAGGALSLVFIPIFNGYLTRGEEEEGWRAFGSIASFLVAALLVAVAALWFALPGLVPLVAPGFDADQAADLVALTRIVLPAQAFHLVGGLLSATLQARDRHALPALAPLLYTGCIVAGGLIGGAEAGAYGFAWGVLVGSALGPFGLPLYGAMRDGMMWRMGGWRHPDLRTYLVRSLPIMLAFSIVMVDDWFLRRQGSLLGEGAISTLQYGKTLMKVPMGVFGLATGVAAYPTLTRLLAEGRREEAYTTLSEAVRRMLVLAFGAQVALTAAGPEIARVIYGSRISAEQHAAIGTALGLLSLGLWAWAAQTVVSRGFYAMGKTWIPPVLGTAIAVPAYPVYVALGRAYGTDGLAIASGVAVTTYVTLLVLMLRREFPGVPDGYGRFFARAVPATALGIGVGLALRTIMPIWHPLLRGGALGVVAFAVYVAATAAFRLDEVREVGALVARRLRRRRA